MVMYALSLIASLVALVGLRFKEPYMERPYRVPIENRYLIQNFPTTHHCNIRFLLVLFITPPILLCIISILLTDRQTKVISILMVLAGVIYNFDLMNS